MRAHGEHANSTRKGPEESLPENQVVPLADMDTRTFLPRGKSARHCSCAPRPPETQHSESHKHSVVLNKRYIKLYPR